MSSYLFRDFEEIPNSARQRFLEHTLYISKLKMALEEISSVKMFDGLQKVFSHVSAETKTKMTFGVFLPKQIEEGNGVADKGRCLSRRSCTSLV